MSDISNGEDGDLSNEGLHPQIRIIRIMELKSQLYQLVNEPLYPQCSPL